MHEIEQTSMQYESAGHAAASLFFLLEAMGSLHPLYRYSLAFFFEVFQNSVRSEGDRKPVVPSFLDCAYCMLLFEVFPIGII